MDDEKVYCIVPVIKHIKEELCDISYKFTGTTSNLKYHLNTIHNISENDEVNKVNINFFVIIYNIY
jgi:hypothetical protein